MPHTNKDNNKVKNSIQTRTGLAIILLTLLVVVAAYLFVDLYFHKQLLETQSSAYNLLTSKTTRPKKNQITKLLDYGLKPNIRDISTDEDTRALLQQSVLINFAHERDKYYISIIPNNVDPALADPSTLDITDIILSITSSPIIFIQNDQSNIVLYDNENNLIFVNLNRGRYMKISSNGEYLPDTDTLKLSNGILNFDLINTTENTVSNIITIESAESFQVEIL